MHAWEESFYPEWKHGYAFVTLFLAQGSLYFGDVIGDGGAVATGTGLHALFFCDVAYEPCGVVMV